MYLQITAGRGCPPVECTRVVYLLSQEIIKDAYNNKIEVTLIDKEESTKIKDTCFSIILKTNSKVFADKWIGIVKWISTSPYRPNHKRKNWYVAVYKIEEKDLPKIDEKKIKYDFFRSSGNGGQNINKVETAVRATYEDISVTASEERTQLRNREIAKEKLLIKLYSQINDIKNQNNLEKWNNNNLNIRGGENKVIKKKLTK